MLRLQCRLNVGKILLDLNQKPKLDPVPKKAKVTSILSTKKIPPPPEEEPPTPCDSPSTAGMDRYIDKIYSIFLLDSGPLRVYISFNF